MSHAAFLSTWHTDARHNDFLFPKKKKKMSDSESFLLIRWIIMVKNKNPRNTPQRPQVNNGSTTFIWETKVANRCLIANTQHISHNQRGPETVVLLQQKHQRTAQQLMWQNSGGRCRIHYISIQRFCKWSRFLITQGCYRRYVSLWKSADTLSDTNDYISQVFSWGTTEAWH